MLDLLTTIKMKTMMIKENNDNNNNDNDETKETITMQTAITTTVPATKQPSKPDTRPPPWLPLVEVVQTLTAVVP